MTEQELKELCRANGVSFIPHHECGICGQSTGWYLFKRWPPYEVAYSSSCGCGDSDARQSSWQEVLEWVCDKNGNLRDEYKQMLPVPAESKPSAIKRIKAGLMEKKEKYTKRGEESDASHDGKGMFWGGVLSTLNEVLTMVEQIEKED